jgi:hypothetical protein
MRGGSSETRRQAVTPWSSTARVVDGATRAPLADAAARRETDEVLWGSYSFAFGPVLALGVVGVLALLLRWAFSSGRSVVERRPTVGRPGEYGLLVPVAEPPTFVEAEIMRRRLAEAGLRATLAPTTDGPRVLVFPEDVKAARVVLRS